MEQPAGNPPNAPQPIPPHASNLRVGRFSQPFGLYYITKCIGIGHSLEEDQRDDIVAALWRLRTKGILYLHAFAVMPDHWHALMSLTDDRSLDLTVRDICREASFRWRQVGLPYAWQRGFHDRKVRAGDVVGDVIAYIENNPVRKGWVPAKEAWRWSSAQAEFAGQLDRAFLGHERWRE
jgi:putative transposase